MRIKDEQFFSIFISFLFLQIKLTFFEDKKEGIVNKILDIN